MDNIIPYCGTLVNLHNITVVHVCVGVCVIILCVLQDYWRVSRRLDLALAARHVIPSTGHRLASADLDVSYTLGGSSSSSDRLFESTTGCGGSRYNGVLSSLTRCCRCTRLFLSSLLSVIVDIALYRALSANARHCDFVLSQQ